MWIIIQKEYNMYKVNNRVPLNSYSRLPIRKNSSILKDADKNC